MIRPISLPVHCAPLERGNSGWREVYRHLAPSEPDDILEGVIWKLWKWSSLVRAR